MSLKRLSIFSFLIAKMFFFSGSMELNCHSFQSFMVLLPSFSTGGCAGQNNWFLKQLVFIGKTLLEKK
jgi:hypothetical protein